MNAARRRRWPSTGVLLVALAACAPSAPRPAGPGADVVLPIRWTGRESLTGEANFLLDAPSGAGTALHLDGTWWSVALTLDGEALPVVTPGPAPLDVPLPPLGAGLHTLAAVVRTPSNEAPIVSLPNKNREPTGGTLTLRLQDTTVVDGVFVALVDGSAEGRVDVSGAPAGATTELRVSRDGDTLAEWGPAPAGTALAAQPWTGPTWALNQPELVVATATIRATDGTVLAERSQRVGVRATTLPQGRLALGAASVPLMALRGQPFEDPSTVAEMVAAAGLDAVELHGAIATSRWFSTFDEWGLPIVQIARCDGRLWGQGEDVATALKHHAPALAEQDTRLLRASAGRPSVVAWACEGADNLRAVSCGGLRADPLKRPIFGVDVPAVSIAGDFAPPPHGPTWVIEVGHPHGGSLPEPGLTAHTFLRGTGTGGPGGVVPRPEGGEGAAWAPAWAAAAQSLGVTPWTLAERRASSVVSVTGLAPGTIAVLRAPGLAAVGAAADATGVARIEAWYVGAAEVVVGGVTKPVTLSADTWVGTRRVTHGVTVGN